MAQKKINYELHTWTFVPYLLIALFIGLWYKDSAEGEPNLMAIVVGLSTIPIFMFLVVRLFALIDKKRKKEVILPRWRDLFLSMCWPLPGRSCACLIPHVRSGLQYLF